MTDGDDDELTDEEVASYRRLRVWVRRTGRKQIMFGLDFRWIERSRWGLYLWCGWFGIVVVWSSFEAYRRATLALGPYRNA